jgi:hypothetical protein
MTQMTATIQQWLESMPIGQKGRFGLLEILGSIGDRFSSCAVSSAGLVIKAGGSTLAKTGSAVTNLVANGIPVAIAASTDMPALTGINIQAGYYNVVCFFVDSAGTTSVAAGTEAATLAGVVFPPFPAGKALVGFLTITYGSAFTGGTTPLDTATTTYNSPTGAWDPSVLVGATNY